MRQNMKEVYESNTRLTAEIEEIKKQAAIHADNAKHSEMDMIKLEKELEKKIKSQISNEFKTELDKLKESIYKLKSDTNGLMDPDKLSTTLKRVIQPAITTEDTDTLSENNNVPALNAQQQLLFESLYQIYQESSQASHKHVQEILVQVENAVPPNLPSLTEFVASDIVDGQSTGNFPSFEKIRLDTKIKQLTTELETTKDENKALSQQLEMWKEKKNKI